MAKPRSTSNLDLFSDFTPGPVVERFEPDQVRAAKCSHRIAQAVSATLKKSGVSRETIAHRMSEFLGDQVPPSTLNQYASPSNETHNIPAHRLLALAVVTGDGARLFNALLQDTDLIAVPKRYEALIRRELAREAAERLTREANVADAQWKAGQR